ncbi:adenylate cyclase [Microvirga vignae]|uniref:Adenylate cyclase n=1 Tax=Microvirga vignae TaxID=1225564 RepID=A0A0H1RD50_9HYPH|nr:adenylate/guanylate cyclase domain-containing protein [Microvirga vignae]KLK92994.1 adenylate cyclase [Microvirga vignae]
MATVRAKRRLAAILVADVVGYSHLVEMDETGTLAALKSSRREVIDPLLAEHHGHIVKLMGDGLIAEFGSVVDAVACAVAIQKGLADHQADVPPDRRIVLRIGVNLGDVVVEGEDLLGDGMNIAARLEQLCEPGGVMISGTAYDHLQGKLDLPLQFAGEQRLKNIERSVRTYRVRLDGAQAALRSRWRRRWPVPVAVAVLLILGLGMGVWLWLGADNPERTQRPAIAVLPFTTLAADEATNRLANGLTDDIITDLSRQTGIDVIARASTEVYKGRPTDVRQIGRDLSVRFVLDGSIQREGDEIRATARLSDTATGAQVWSNRWDRPVRDVFAVQTEIAEQVIGQFEMLTGPLKTPGLAAAKRKRPESLTAYELTLLGVEKQLSPTRESIAESMQILNKAIEVDPNYAQAWVELAWAHTSAGTYGADAAASSQAALSAARRAVELDPNAPDAHSVLGHVLATRGEFDQAKSEFETSLRLNPSSFSILVYYARWASTFGEAERGAVLADRAIRLNPSYRPWASGFMRYAYFMAGRYKDALQAMDRQMPDNYSKHAWVQRAASFAALGRMEEARTTLGETLKRYPDLTIEDYVSDPGLNDTDREHLIRTMKLAGFPLCVRPEMLARIARSVRLPECIKS